MIEKTIKSRPTSPHLEIYKLQISSVLSIGHRLTGIALFLFLLDLCWWFTIWVFSDFDPYYLTFFDNIWIKCYFVLASYVLFYHFCTGIRHLIWDTGMCFSISAINISGIIAVCCSFFMTAIFWLYM